MWCSYRALYDYSRHNNDEVSLLDGDVVEVMERCDDGWYVGLNRRTAQFGTFPGNYVEPINRSAASSFEKNCTTPFYRATLC